MPNNRSQIVYLIRYRRAGHPAHQSRPYLQRYAVEQMLERLIAGDPALAPLVELSLEAHPLGAPQITDS